MALVGVVGIGSTAFSILSNVKSIEQHLIHDASLHVRSVQNECAAAVDFKRYDVAEAVLKRLSVFPEIELLVLYNSNNIEVASYVNKNSGRVQIPKEVNSENIFLEKNHLFSKHILNTNTEPIGFIIIAVSTSEINQEINKSIRWILITLLIVFMVTYFLALRLQSYISEPILRLAGVARKITDESNYSIRVKKTSEDEIGSLYDEFNFMINKVQESSSELQTSEERLKFALEGANDGFWDWDLTTNKIYLSARAQEMFEFDTEIIDGNFFLMRKYTFLEDFKIFAENIREYLRGKIPGFECEFRVKRKNSEVDWILTKGKIVKRDETGKALRFVGTHSVITERKRIESELKLAKEAAEKTNILKTEFLAQMSHEIRSPINIILSYMGLLKDDISDNVNDNLDDYFTSISSAGQRIIRTIDLILNMAEIQTGIYEPSITKIELFAEVLEPISQEYSGYAKAKNLNLSLSSNIEDAEIFADKYSIYQIFANLVDNSIKYTPKGKVEIKLYLDRDNMLAVDIADSGIGIAEDYIPNLFKPFTQEEQGYTRSFEGNGLGLALVKRYCDLNNLRIEVKSVKNTGTTFTVTFL
ncbi:MAG: PAS domain-containing protein [Bacteroidetes bacterium]|nr:PAS domain-containing protein [Bacteroidota bacterium]